MRTSSDQRSSARLKAMIFYQLSRSFHGTCSMLSLPSCLCWCWKSYRSQYKGPWPIFYDLESINQIGFCLFGNRGCSVKSRNYPFVRVSAIVERKRKGTGGTLFLLLLGGSLEFSFGLKNFVDLLTEELKLWKISKELIWLCWRLRRLHPSIKRKRTNAVQGWKHVKKQGRRLKQH
ncbi:uncharacterized protein [Pyrus communis]|uniref:uncharacterized protein n=1 Tax=Pyrus communis TaxID=23211 RepID=UPI0035C11C11